MKSHAGSAGAGGTYYQTGMAVATNGKRTGKKGGRLRTKSSDVSDVIFFFGYALGASAHCHWHSASFPR